MNHPDAPDNPLLASVREIMSTASNTFEVKPWKEIMATKNAAAAAKSKEVKNAAKKVATTKAAPYKHKSTGQDMAAGRALASSDPEGDQQARTDHIADTDQPTGSVMGWITSQVVPEVGIDSAHSGMVHSVSDHQPGHQENLMTKQTEAGLTKQDADTATVKAKIAEKEAKQKAAAEAKAKKAADDAEKAEAKAKAAAEKQATIAAAAAEKEKSKAEKAAKAAENKTAREAHAAELAAAGRKYVGSMLALSERVKTGAYVKSTTGQLRSTDAIAEAFDAVPPQNVVKLGTLLLNEPNKYAALNIGQQSMNYRNRLRGAVRSGAEINGVKITIELIVAKIVELGLDTGRAEAEAKLKTRAEKAEKIEAAKKAKAEAKAKAEEAALAKKAEAETKAKEASQKKAAEASQAQAAV